MEKKPPCKELIEYLKEKYKFNAEDNSFQLISEDFSCYWKFIFGKKAMKGLLLFPPAPDNYLYAFSYQLMLDNEPKEAYPSVMDLRQTVNRIKTQGRW